MEPSAPVAASGWCSGRQHGIGLGERLLVAGPDRFGDRFANSAETGRGSMFGGVLGVVEHATHRCGPRGVLVIGADIGEVAGGMGGALGVGCFGEFFTVVGGEPVVHDHPAVAGEHPDGDDRVDPPAGVTGEQRQLRCRRGVHPAEPNGVAAGGSL